MTGGPQLRRALDEYRKKEAPKVRRFLEDYRKGLVRRLPLPLDPDQTVWRKG